jgi:hypothetical protein
VSVESLIYNTLRGLVANRVYQDITPPDVTALPRITYQQVGGRAISFLESGVPSLKNGRFQVNVWGATRLQAAALSRQVEDALVLATALQTTPLGAPVAEYESETKLYGTRQDFSFWF